MFNLTKIKLKIKKTFLTGLLKMYFPNIVFKTINTPEGFQKVYDLLWQVYGLEENYVNTNTFGSPLKAFGDKYEKFSVTIGAFDGETLVGTLRMIFSSPLGFYAQEDFNIDLSAFSQVEVVEISRMATLKPYRKKSLVVFGLIKKALEISKEKGKKYWIIVTFEKLKNHFSEFFGIEFCPLEARKLTEKQLECRKKMSRYYDKNPVPYIIQIQKAY